MSASPFAVTVELDADGSHPSAWRAASHAPAELLSPRRIATVAQAAERFGFTAATFEDSPLPPVGPGVVARLDAVQRAAFAAGRTSAIGVIPVAHVAFSEPFHVATQLASLDWASSGRAGWIAAASGSAREAAAFGREPLDEAALRRERDDVIEVARRLWDSWDDDAVIRDVATGRYLDADRLHYADFEGETFSVKGPLITPRPPQGQLVVAAEAGTTGIDIALVAGSDVSAVTRAADAAGGTTASGLGERPDAARGAPLVWVEIEVLLDARGRRAADRLDDLGPWAPTPRLRHVGDAASLVELIASLAAAVDGIRVHPAVIDVDLEELGRAVLPALRERIGFRSPVPGGTLRDALGLDRPASRYALAAPVVPVEEFA